MVKLINSKMNSFGYDEWCGWFSANKRKAPKFRFTREDDLTQKERSLIFPSIKSFERGESSDGAHFSEAARNFAVEYDEPAYTKAAALFVNEENRHSEYLRVFMENYGVMPEKNPFLDIVFRILRKLGGLKCEVTVLVTAEMIALTYYDALGRCTGSPALKRICRQMLHDELPHIMFQSYTLSHFTEKPYDVPIRYILTAATAAAVWAAYGDVFRAGGYSFFGYLAECFGYLGQSVTLTEMHRKK